MHGEGVIIPLRVGAGRVVAGLARGQRKVRTPRAGCWVMPRRSDPTPAQQKAYRRWPERDQARLKWRGKNPPRARGNGGPAKGTPSKGQKEGVGRGGPGLLLQHRPRRGPRGGRLWTPATPGPQGEPTACARK